MSTFEYTRELDTQVSGLVDEAYYNENTGDLAVDLNDKVYVYKSVPADVADLFEDANSAGEFYNDHIKRQYGPGSRLGFWTTVKYVEVPAEPKEAPVYATGGPVTVGKVAESVLTTHEADRMFSLKPFTAVEVEGTEREYSVTFKVDGLDGRRTYRTKANSLDEAVGNVLDIGKMLNLTFVVREVTVSFE